MINIMKTLFRHQYLYTYHIYSIIYIYTIIYRDFNVNHRNNLLPYIEELIRILE